VSYDPAPVLKDFTERRRITFPLLSGRDSAIIRRFGLLNAEYPEGDLTHGVPYPMTFIADEHGVVRSKFFEGSYVNRRTAASILALEGEAVAPTRGVTADLVAKIPHDFRRAAVRNLARIGVDRKTVMEMVGHKTESIYRRYTITDEAMLRDASARLAVLHEREKNRQSTAKVSGESGDFQSEPATAPLASICRY
jgi:hypothetical protein